MNQLPALISFPKTNPMYYPGEFFQVLQGTAGKPIDIVLFGGKVSLHTHPGDETSLLAENITDGKLMPHLHATENGIRIDKQSVFSLFHKRQFDKMVLRIYVPENSDVNIVMRGGEMQISGKYKNLRARNDAGQIQTDMKNLSVEEQAVLSVFAGEIRLNNGNANRKHYRRLRMKAGSGNLDAKVAVGEVRISSNLA